MKSVFLIFAVLAILGLQISFAQTRDISGTVSLVDDGASIPGASVVVKGTTFGAITGLDGNFTLKVPQDASTLIVSFVGMKTKEVPLSVESLYNILLGPDNIYVDQIVVTALGISREKKALGYAVQEVEGESFSEAHETNIVSALSGKVAGVQVSAGSSNIGGSSRILIRGANSIGGNNEPLFVVDGIPFDNKNFNVVKTQSGKGGIDFGNMAQDINPADIESVSVLKGPSAAALYGSRASNGVIMITTKKGRKQKGIGVSVSSGVSFEEVSLLPDLQRTYGGGAGDFKTEVINGKEYQVVNYAMDESWGPKFEGQQVLHWDAFDEWDSANYLKTREWKAPDSDVEEFFDRGLTYNNNISFSGGDDDRDFRLSLTSVNSDGYIPNSELDKTTISFNGQSKLGKNLTASATLNYVKTVAKGRPFTGASSLSPIRQFTQWGQSQLDINRLRNYKNPDGSQRPWNRTAWNNPLPRFIDTPFWIINEDTNDDSRDRFYGNLGLVWNISKNLSASVKGFKDVYTFRERVRISRSKGPSQYSEWMNQVDEENFELMINFNRQLSKNLNLAAMIGGNLRSNDLLRSSAGSRGGLVLPGLYTLSNSKDPAYVNSYEEHEKVNSLFGSFSMGWRDVIFIDGTFRNDWSSTLPEDNRSYFYPSFTSSIILTELEALESVNFLSFAKLRAGWAMVGNDTDPYRLHDNYTDNATTNFDGVPRYSVPDVMSNKNLEPEITYSWEIGGDFRFFKSRLGLDVTYYSSKTVDLITNIPISGSSGYLSTTTNAGSMTNKGVELMLIGKIVRSNDFEWDLSLNFARNRNKLVELYSGIDNYQLGKGYYGISVNAFVGESYGALMGTNFIFDDNGNKLVSTSGRWQETTDVEVLGSVMPDFSMGVINSFKFKNFDLSGLIDIQKGGQYFSASNLCGMYSGLLKESVWHNGVGIRENGIVLEGVYGTLGGDGNIQYSDADGNLSATPVKNSTSITANRYGTDFYHKATAQNIFDATYIKLRELSLGYSVPASYVGDIKGLRISVFGRNLAIWGLDNKNIDPETAVTSSQNIQGIEGSALPSTRTYGLNVKLNF
jgi:TonB-linked SusC/RagA family outer membrane protein